MRWRGNAMLRLKDVQAQVAAIVGDQEQRRLAGIELGVALPSRVLPPATAPPQLLLAM